MPTHLGILGTDTSGYEKRYVKFLLENFHKLHGACETFMQLGITNSYLVTKYIRLPREQIACCRKLFVDT